jgi:hypothetical protein
MPAPLGSLEPVDLRAIWLDEARDFKPWLAQEDNLRRLSEALNPELELDAMEVVLNRLSFFLRALPKTYGTSGIRRI